ncbi:hypothetical protein EDD86DRAFT_8510 [Gorgonomyces haynaldii]|nr:hypothetical protein EDD86DRAFT_8510 [Gorgonomyces haynaldii]
MFFPVVMGCAQQSKFQQCSQDAHLQVSQCQTNGTPDQSYYQCLCNGDRQLLKCYDICADDNELRLQKQQVDGRVSTSCQAAQEIKDRSPQSSKTDVTKVETTVSGTLAISSQSVTLASVSSQSVTLTSLTYKSQESVKTAASGGQVTRNDITVPTTPAWLNSEQRLSLLNFLLVWLM